MADPIEWKSLIDSLVHRSETLETSATQDRTNALEALEDLNLLSSLTEESLLALDPPPAPAPEPEPVFAAVTEEKPSPGARTPAPALKPSPKMAVKVPERYQTSAVLKDESVLNALMEYHSLRNPVRGATVTPQPAARSAPAGDSPEKATRRQSPQFRPAEIPIVEDLQRKDPPIKTNRSAHPTAPVLRSRNPRT